LNPADQPLTQPMKSEPHRPGPLTGAYYWVPSPATEGLGWELITCHHLRVWDGVSHREAWPYVLEPLAAAWGKDSKVLKRRLRDHYTGVPRGRVTHPRRGFLIVHGNDSPVPDWLDRIRSSFQLADVKPTPLFDEHERMLGEDLRAVQDALGVSLGLVKMV
jgi:hypothetical protein